VLNIERETETVAKAVEAVLGCCSLQRKRLPISSSGIIVRNK
jgi:hypothetical protein